LSPLDSSIMNKFFCLFALFILLYHSPSIAQQWLDRNKKDTKILVSRGKWKVHPNELIALNYKEKVWLDMALKEKTALIEKLKDFYIEFTSDGKFRGYIIYPIERSDGRKSIEVEEVEEGTWYIGLYNHIYFKTYSKNFQKVLNVGYTLDGIDRNTFQLFLPTADYFFTVKFTTSQNLASLDIKRGKFFEGKLIYELKTSHPTLPALAKLARTGYEFYLSENYLVASYQEEGKDYNRLIINCKEDTAYLLDDFRQKINKIPYQNFIQKYQPSSTFSKPRMTGEFKYIEFQRCVEVVTNIKTVNGTAEVHYWVAQHIPVSKPNGSTPLQSFFLFEPPKGLPFEITTTYTDGKWKGVTTTVLLKKMVEMEVDRDFCKVPESYQKE